jgi:hypothetical protein
MNTTIETIQDASTPSSVTNNIIIPIALTEITKKTVAVVKFNMPLTVVDTGPGKFFQVTIDPGKLSPTGKYIRFGNNPGDELVGWQLVEWIAIEEILGEWVNEDTPPILEYKPHRLSDGRTN